MQGSPQGDGVEGRDGGEEVGTRGQSVRGGGWGGGGARMGAQAAVAAAAATAEAVRGRGSVDSVEGVYEGPLPSSPATPSPALAAPGQQVRCV